MFTITFYSYKGGVGRTLALSNTALALSKRGGGAKIAILDCDLEAPGIDHIVQFQPDRFPKKGGIVEYIHQYFKQTSPDPKTIPSILDYVYPAKHSADITVIPAGKKDQNYQLCLSRLNWEELYKDKQGYQFFQQLKIKIEEDIAPDYLLVDSRTGLADIAGITTHQLADLVVLVFALNQQNLEGIQKAYHSISSTPDDDSPPPPKTLLVASPVPNEHGRLVYDRLMSAVQAMPLALNANIEGKNRVIQIPYHPILALEDITLLIDHPQYEISKAYRQIGDAILKHNPEEMSHLLEKAFNYQNENLFEEAEEEFQKIIRQQPDNAIGLFHYGDFLMKQGRWQEAVTPLKQACDGAAQNASYRSTLGTVLEYQKHYEEALSVLQEAEALAPKNEFILQKIANLYYKLDNIEKHLEYIDKQNRVRLPESQSDGVEPRERFDALITRFMETDHPYFEDQSHRHKFWDLLKGSISISFNGKILIIRSIITKDMSILQLKQLEKMFEEETEKFCEVWGAKFSLIQDKIRHGELESIQNESDLKHLIQKENSEDSIVFSVLLADVQLNQQKYSEAIKTIEQAFQNKPNTSDAELLYLRWGTSLGQLADLQPGEAEKEKCLEEACEKYQMATKIKPDDDSAFYNWGNALDKLADLQSEEAEKEKYWTEAYEKYQMATKIKPDQDRAFYNWGITLGKLADLQSEGAEKEKCLIEACEKYQMATKIKPDDDSAFNNWATALSKRSQLKRGKKRIEILKEALEKAQMAESIQEGAGLYNMACAYALLQEKEQALSTLEKAIEFNASYQEMARKDDDFKDLRKDERFIAQVPDASSSI